LVHNLFNEWAADFGNIGHSGFPDLVLKSCLNDDRNPAAEVVVYYVKKEIGHYAIGVRRKLIVLEAIGVDIALLQLIATDDWHP
jgi:hypothetical protein